MEADEEIGHRDDVAVLILGLGEEDVGQPDGVHAAVVQKDRLVHAVESKTRVSPLLPQVETGRHLLKQTQCVGSGERGWWGIRLMQILQNTQNSAIFTPSEIHILRSS